jgi:Transposase DDE domain
MPNPAKTAGWSHFQSQCHSLAQDKSLLHRVFSESMPRDFNFSFRVRVYTPLVTTWLFINQILSSDHSCQVAVASLVALQSAIRVKVVSSATAAYCRARLRLPLAFISTWARRIGERLLNEVPENIRRWKGFDIFLVDGSTLNIPDTKANAQKFSRPTISRGLLKARVLGVFSLASGGLVEFAFRSFSGKGCGEVSMLRDLIPRLCATKALVIMDKLFGDLETLSLLCAHRIEFIVPRFANHSSYYRIERLGKNDYLVALQVRGSDEILILREVRIYLKTKGFRVKTLDLVTSLIDPKLYSKDDIAQAYWYRWNAETDFRSLKCGLKMDILRCQTPEMIEKEIWAHILVYNLIHTVMTEAAINSNRRPREISFMQTVQVFASFRLPMAMDQGVQRSHDLYQDLLRALKDRVGNRPGRAEPRLLKHNPKRYDLLKIPRQQAREGFWKKGHAGQKRRQELNVA